MKCWIRTQDKRKLILCDSLAIYANYDGTTKEEVFKRYEQIAYKNGYTEYDLKNITEIECEKFLQEAGRRFEIAFEQTTLGIYGTYKQAEQVLDAIHDNLLHGINLFKMPQNEEAQQIQ